MPAYAGRMTPPAPAVRRATADDAATLAQLLVAFNAEYGDDAGSPDVLTRRYQTMLGGGQFAAWLAGDPAIGFATVALRPSVYLDGPAAVLEDFYVAPERRNHGIGSALIGAVLEAAAAEGWGSVEIQVDEPDVDAMRFYARHGFVDRNPDTGDRALLWWRSLE